MHGITICDLSCVSPATQFGMVQICAVAAVASLPMQ